MTRGQRRPARPPCRIGHLIPGIATPVAGLREGAIVACDAGRFSLRGMAGARLFRRGREPVEAMPVTDVTDGLTPEAAR